jgi:hypothetical protein
MTTSRETNTKKARVDKIMELVLEIIKNPVPNYYWKGMNKDIHPYIKYCLKCQMYKPQKQNNNAENIPLQNQVYRSQELDLDLIGRLPKTRRGNRYIIVFHQVGGNRISETNSF